eukprot:TRINITY_DN100829_c0_g1_i1.p1 TRINITY_DN100829_c0_g1~~TRINITY_DN100829_c0_g1_i1.p1  ORF type:complete len:427 (-),score=129.69 TRINITY_DN100829_c0_g1_i1:18-1298(-)
MAFSRRAAGAEAEGLSLSAADEAVPIEKFFKAFFGSPPTAPHSSKFKPDGKNWSEYTVSVKSLEGGSDSKRSVRPMARGRPAPAAASEQDLGQAAAVSSSTPPPQEAGLSKPSLPLALLFPGQGSQYVSMLSELQQLPAVQQMLQVANDILGYDLLQLCLKGPEDTLGETKFCQPAVFVAGMVGLEKLKTDRGEAVTQFRATAGLSLGEYTALCAAGVFTFQDGLKLVQLRGEAMQEAAARSEQAMLSVAGLEKSHLVKLCELAAAEEGGEDAVCEVVNELFTKGYACAGTANAVKALKQLADKEPGCLQARLLKTSGAFHTKLMAPAQQRLAEALDATLPRMRPPQHTVYMNVNATPLAPGTDPAVIVGLLKAQLCSPVLWEQTMTAMIDDGITEFYEVGPMKQLKAMMKRINMKACNATTNVEV